MTTRESTHAAAPAAARTLASPEARRITLYCAILLAIFALSLARQYGAADGFIRDLDGRPRLNDFAGVWTAGELVNAGHPAAAYDWTQHRAAQDGLRGGTDTDFYAWPYPPTFLAVASLLATLPFGAAMLAWLAVTFAAYVAVLARVTGAWQGGIVLAAAPVTLLTAFAGQNGFFSAALMGAGLVQLQTRPWLGGAILGLLSYKPHLGLMIPVALLAAAQWRAIAGAAASTLALALVSIALYGPEPWVAFFEQMSRIGGAVGTAGWSFKLQSVYGLMRTLGSSASPALAVHAMTVVAVAAALALVWRREAPFALKAAALAAASMLASPYQFIYDLTLLVVAQGFLVRHLLDEGATRAEIVGLIAAALLLGLFAVAAAPVGLAASLLTAALIGRRVLAGWQHGRLSPAGA